MTPYQKIGEIEIFINSRNPLFCDFSQTERELLSKEVEKLYVSLIINYKEKDDIYAEANFTKSGDLILSLKVFVKFINLFTNTFNYNNVSVCLNKIIEGIKNQKIFIKNIEKFLISIMKMNIASLSTAIFLFERGQADLLKENNDGKYILFQNEDDLFKFFNTKLGDNFFFINSHQLTDFHEIDVKLIEARYCLALGLTLSSVAMLCITLEETLKSLLKYKYLKELHDASTERPSLSEISRVSKAVQNKYGSKTLGPLIQSARAKDIINDEEKNKFEDLKILRDGHMHSDKSKIFSKNKAPVQLISMEDGIPKVVEVKNMSMDELIFAQGVTQKQISDRYAKFIFFDIEEHILNVCKRFWKEHHN